MSRILKRLRASLTLGGFWGVAAGAAAAACQAFLQLLGGGLAWDLLLQAAVPFGFAGWVVGAAFAGTLLEFELRGILRRVERWRMGLWGAVMGGGVSAALIVIGGGTAALGGLGLGVAAVIGATVGASLSVFTSSLAKEASAELAKTTVRSLSPEGASVRPGSEQG